MGGRAKSSAAIIGIGELKPSRYTEGKTTLGMIAESVCLAVQDAGLEKEAIDGLLVGPQVGETPQHVPATVSEYLGLEPKMSNVVDLGGATGPGMLWRAQAAIDAGMCETVVCVLGNINEKGKALRSPNRNPIREFDVPFGASGANTSYALLKRRHMEQYGSKQEDFALLAHWARKNAQLNPDAIFYGQPASVEDVMASPVIVDPLHLFEIVMPVAGGAAVVITSNKRLIHGCGHAPVYLLGAGEKVTHRAVSQAPDLEHAPLSYAIPHALAQARVGINDMDLLSLYDCYTSVVATTIENAGLCAPGQFGKWVSEHTLGHDGDWPLNTHGGQLGFGQADLAGGMSHVIEAVRQLRLEAHGRQIKDAQYALVTGNGATLSEATALVLGGEA
ncbi:thiolase family protein [Aquibacillus koreensis]|uniref:Thiolase family protein n=1 Tax=Aquibacillus koreensis TaxID=279446 RepID=A0A9X4AJR5_9BACI|nr:thiolase family protein [Aquibacillus koreensis]MCT2535347.1 thiolase family protein [Aquibacillus koreensis]MDC3422512.1 thiolase family protein [Aquibacillus koreensis]